MGLFAILSGTAAMWCFFILKGKKMTIKNYSIVDTENDGTLLEDGIPDGLKPSEVIGVYRKQMADHRAQWNEAEWFEYCDGTPDGSVSFVSSSQFMVTGSDASSHYHVGRRVKIIDGSGTVYASITAVTGTGPITVTIDGTLTSPVSSVYTGVLSSVNHSLPIEAVQDIVGSMLAGNTTSAIDVTYQDSDGTIDFEVTANATDNNFSDAHKTKLDGVATSANNYIHPTAAGDKHIPTGGSSGQILQYSASGTATWATPNFITSDANDTATGIYTFSNTSASSSKTTGAVRVTGGVGIQGALNVGGNITAYASSDIRNKNTVKPIDNALRKLETLTGNSFFYNHPSTIADQGKQYGVIAQEVAAVFPEMIVTSDEGSLTIRQAGFELSALLIEAVKELSLKIRKLENE